jgi:hypothetical protein
MAVGLSFQMSITIAQGNSKLEDMSTVTATVFCRLIYFFITVCSIADSSNSLSNHRRRIFRLGGTVRFCESHDHRTPQDCPRSRYPESDRNGGNSDSARFPCRPSAFYRARLYGRYQGYIGSHGQSYWRCMSPVGIRSSEATQRRPAARRCCLIPLLA